MNLREIDNFLKDKMPQSEAHRALDRIGHWIDKLKFEKKYETSIASEVKALKNIQLLGLVNLKENKMFVEAELTEDAHEVYKEMVSRGFFLKKGKV